MEYGDIEKAIQERAHWESGTLGKSEEFIEFKTEEHKKETIFNFFLKIERYSTALVMSDSLMPVMADRNISPVEIGECLDNRRTLFAADTLETDTAHQTLWFIGETKKSRKLKLILLVEDNSYILVNVYEPSDQEIRIYSSAPAK